MKTIINHILRLLCLPALLALTSCSGEEMTPATPIEEGAPVSANLRIGVSEMEMTAASRAVSPMSPDIEKYVSTIALFEFDNEGWHVKGDRTYHFIDFVAGTVDGVKGVGNVESTEYGIVETRLDGIALEARTGGTLCVVANVTEEEVDDFYANYREENQSYGTMSLTKFKTWALPFTYDEPSTEVYDESTTGYVKTMYMFEFYEGPIDPSTVGDIRVDLGRLASRLDITIVNQTGSDITKRLGYHFDDVCGSAYFFPILSSMPPTIGAGLARTVICAGENDPVEGDPDFKVVPETFPDGAIHTRYYYVAAHSAENYDDATKLHLFYDRRIVEDSEDNTNCTWVPLCNVHPSYAGEVKNGYSLSRNTRYHFTIRLKSRPSAASPRMSGPSAHSIPCVEYGDTPGDITVWLPE